MTNQASGTSGSETQAQFRLQRIYVKDLSFEAPGAPDIFKSEWKPEVSMELNNKSSKIEENYFEVLLSITLTAKNDGKVAYVLEIQQAGLFMVSGVSQEQLPHLLGSYCPSIIFPYAREAISDVVGKGSFPQMLLAPVNFDALFEEAVKRNAAEQTGGSRTLN